MREGKLCLSVFFIISLISSCQGKNDYPETVNSIDFSNLEEIVTSTAIDAAIISFHGDLVWDYYADNWSDKMIHTINSCTKSIVSILIGTLFDQGLLHDIDLPVYTLFPTINPEEIPEANKKITLHHFLTMSTGLASRDSYLYGRAGLKEIWLKENWIKEILLLDSESPGGTRFDYSNLASFLLGEIVRSVTEQDINDYAQEKLFAPLGIDIYEWKTNLDGQTLGWAGLYMRPADLVKIGQLILQDGLWQGRRIVSSEWVKRSTQAHIITNIDNEHYGYQWWIDAAGWVMAVGDGGQYLIINQKLDLVTVFLSDFDEADVFIPLKIYRDTIIPLFTMDSHGKLSEQ